jgi:hypothetical protein
MGRKSPYLTESRPTGLRPSGLRRVPTRESSLPAARYRGWSGAFATRAIPRIPPHHTGAQHSSLPIPNRSFPARLSHAFRACPSCTHRHIMGSAKASIAFAAIAASTAHPRCARNSGQWPWRLRRVSWRACACERVSGGGVGSPARGRNPGNPLGRNNSSKGHAFLHAVECRGCHAGRAGYTGNIGSLRLPAACFTPPDAATRSC